jgi:hypothetical protein
MYSSYRNAWAVLALLAASSYSCENASAQSFKFAGNLGDPIVAGHAVMDASPCLKDALMGRPARHADATPAGVIASSCDEPSATATTAIPCRPAILSGTGCESPSDPVEMQLIAMGKAGQKIFRAREKVLDILQTGNPCKTWFQERDSNPAATFRTLSFVLDSHGDEYVLESAEPGQMNIFRSPYVAKVIQGDGAGTAVTLNMNGAFFSTMARVVEVSKEGGPSNYRGTRLLHVGPYDGDTLPAQVITLLHEFGHVLDLLPNDRDDLDGKSGKNTNEVLRSCSAEVQLLTRHHTLAAGH